MSISRFCKCVKIEVNAFKPSEEQRYENSIYASHLLKFPVSIYYETLATDR